MTRQFSRGQLALYQTLLHELHVEIQPEFLPYLVDESIFTCYVADVANASKQRLALYREVDSDAPESRLGSNTKSRLIDVTRPMTEAVRLVFAGDNNPDFREVVMTITANIGMDRRFHQTNMNFTKKEDDIVTALIVGTALFGCSLAADGEMGEGQLRRLLGIHGGTMDELRNELTELFKVGRNVPPEDIHKG